jgi:hypothetical protein
MRTPKGSDRREFRGVEADPSGLLASSPGRTHTLAEGPGTAFHFYAFLVRYMEEHLPPGAARTEETGR